MASNEPFIIRQVTEKPQDLVSELLFLRRDPIHDVEKPYKLSYDPGSEISRTNCSNETVSKVAFSDLRRGNVQKLSYDENGFAILYMQTQLQPDEFYDEERVRAVYYEELKCLLKDYFQARKVEVLEHLIRRRHVDFPISTGEDYKYLQPTTVVHVDFTEESALSAMENILADKREDYQRIQCVKYADVEPKSIWKPLRGPVQDWPLAMCDARSVSPGHDLIEHDVVSRTGFTENYQVYHNIESKWYYISNQMPDELCLFRQSDTMDGKSFGIPHSGFRNPQAPPSAAPRESIETRLFVYF